MLHLLRRTLIVMALLVPFGAACGDDDTDTTPTSGTEEPGGTADGGATGGETPSEAPSELEFTAVDIAFEEEEATGAAAELQVRLVNEGAIEHSWLVEGHESDLRLYTPQSGDTDEGTITLEAGDYTYYCDIPGHRDAGMEGDLTVE